MQDSCSDNTMSSTCTRPSCRSQEFILILGFVGAVVMMLFVFMVPSGDNVVLVVNNLGGTSVLELNVVTRAAINYLGMYTFMQFK